MCLLVEKLLSFFGKIGRTLFLACSGCRKFGTFYAKQYVHTLVMLSTRFGPSQMHKFCVNFISCVKSASTLL